MCLITQNHILVLHFDSSKCRMIPQSIMQRSPQGITGRKARNIKNKDIKSTQEQSSEYQNGIYICIWHIYFVFRKIIRNLSSESYKINAFLEYDTCSKMTFLCFLARACILQSTNGRNFENFSKDTLHYKRSKNEIILEKTIQDWATEDIVSKSVIYYLKLLCVR